MKKRYWLIMVVAALIVTFAASGVGAQEKVEFEELRLTTVREEKISVPRYLLTLGGWVEEVVGKLVDSGEPAVVFKRNIVPALEVTLIEGFLHRNVNLIGGATFENDEPVDVLIGGKYTGFKEKSGGIWEWFATLQPVVGIVDGELCLALSYAWKEPA